MATIFVSPGVYTKEQDFSVFASRIGITRLGLVGKTASVACSRTMWLGRDGM